MMLQSGIYFKKNLRLTVEGILYRIRTGCPWRDLPSIFGKWNSVYKRFNEWSKSDKLMKVFNIASSNDPDFEWVFIDGSIVKSHQHSMGAVKGEETAIGKSVAGNTTKIHAVVDSMGLPIKFEITGGEVHDSQMAPYLVASVPKAEYVVGDKGYDSEELRKQIEHQGSQQVIPRKANSKIGNDDIDFAIYKLRHLVENIFARIKHFRAVATRYDKLKRNFKSVIALAFAYLWLPLIFA
jgi:transposase